MPRFGNNKPTAATAKNEISPTRFNSAYFCPTCSLDL